MVPAAPSAGTVTGYSRGSPCTPGMLAALGLAARGSCKQTKNPEYFRKVFPPPPPLFPVPPPYLSLASSRAALRSLFPWAQHPKTLLQLPSPARLCHLQTLFFFLFFFLAIYVYFSFPFSFPPSAFSHAIRLPLLPPSPCHHPKPSAGRGAARCGVGLGVAGGFALMH